jgi:hypothetical protein
MAKPNDFLTPAPDNYVWPRCPEADLFIEEILTSFLDGHSFSRHLAARMKSETSTLFSVWVDHVILPRKKADPARLKEVGFVEDKKVRRAPGVTVYWHPFADLPRIVVSPRAKAIGCAIMVEDIWRFQLANGVSRPIEGAPFSSYRVMRIADKASELLVVERRGSLTLVPDTSRKADVYLRNFERWAARPRRFDDQARGMRETLALAQSISKEVGAGAAAHLFLEGERIYWQRRNQAAQVQKARQDRLGLGWANHDHHTFRSSRAAFPMLIKILLAFGFKKRERYFAGADAGWGAQVMEQPDAGTIIFADVDLSPADTSVDFSKVAMPELDRHRTVGLWCALHGDSILQAGMHHLEAKFDFDQLRDDLKERHIDTMPPFSDFPHLRQAFTKGEMWPVPEGQLRALLQKGKISNEAFEQIQKAGAVGSHLENLQRRDGFKGFNQKGVSHIITAVNPEKLALSDKNQTGAA